MGIVLTITEGRHANTRYACQPYEVFILGRDTEPGKGPGFPLDPYMSRRHVLFEISGDRVRVEDLGSSNGIYVNGHRIRNQELHSGDELRAGRTVLRVTIEAGAPAPARPPPAPSPNAGPPRAKPPPRRPRSEHPAAITRPLPPEPPVAQPVVPPPSPPPVPVAPKPKPAPVRKRADFQVLDEIAHGGLGVVYRAKERDTGRLVALKVMLNTMEMDEMARGHFVREMRIISGLHHPNLVKTYGVGSGAGEAWIAMEYVDGPDLWKYVKTRKPLGVVDALSVGIQLLRGLGYAHDQGLVHRDVKPANALLSGRPGQIRAKLADFGLAKSLQSTGASGLTVTGTGKGSLWFVAPEQLVDAKSAGVPADLYGFGATLYFALTGKWHLREDGKFEDFMAGILDYDYCPIGTRVRLPAGLAQVIDAALKPRPKERPQDAHLMEAFLAKTLESLPSN